MQYSKPSQLPDGRYYSKITNEDQSRVLVQLNNVKLLTKFESEDDDVTLSLSDVVSEKIQSYDDKTLQAARENSTDWFGKDLPEKTLETAFTRSLTSGCMNVSKLKSKSKFLTRIYSHDKQLTDSNVLEENTVCDVVLELSGVWFMKKTFGLVWRIVQVRMKPPTKKPKDPVYLFQDEEEDKSSSSDEDLF
jgi:hypothetical protein